MRKFWSQNEPLTSEETQLVVALYTAHQECTFRNNCSTAALQQAAFGSRKLGQSLIAALATLGEAHGPIEDAYDFLFGEKEEKDFKKLPGWGNSFIKGEVDPAFQRVDAILEGGWPKVSRTLYKITDTLHAEGKKLFPNPAAYTAAVAFIIGMPAHLAPLLFIEARLQPWAAIFHNTLTAQAAEKEVA